MTLDAIIVYGKIIEEDGVRILAHFGTTNPWRLMQLTDLTEDELRTDFGVNLHNKEKVEVFATAHPAETEEDLLCGDYPTRYIGEYSDEYQCMCRIINAFRDFFGPRKKDVMKYYVKPMTEAVMYDDKSSIFELQSRFIDAYEGTPLLPQVRTICQMVKGGNWNTILDNVKILEALQKEDYQTAAKLKKSLDNRAQGI